MATLAQHGRITTDVVDGEVRRLNDFWRVANVRETSDTLVEEVLGTNAAARLDRFDVPQLAAVIRACREHPTASAADRSLFAHSRLYKKSSNDADRLSKYLARLDLKFDDVRKSEVG